LVAAMHTEVLAEGFSPRDVARALAVELRLPRRELYAEVLAIAGASRSQAPDGEG
jgi:hypothetical protein